MTNKNAAHISEFVKVRNALIAIALTVSLIFLEQVINLPLWASVPIAALTALAVRYFYLKRGEETQYEESE